VPIVVNATGAWERSSAAAGNLPPLLLPVNASAAEGPGGTTQQQRGTAKNDPFGGGLDSNEQKEFKTLPSKPTLRLHTGKQADSAPWDPGVNATEDTYQGVNAHKAIKEAAATLMGNLRVLDQTPPLACLMSVLIWPETWDHVLDVQCFLFDCGGNQSMAHVLGRGYNPLRDREFYATNL